MDAVEHMLFFTVLKKAFFSVSQERYVCSTVLKTNKNRNTVHGQIWAMKKRLKEWLRSDYTYIQTPTVYKEGYTIHTMFWPQFFAERYGDDKPFAIPKVIFIHIASVHQKCQWKTLASHFMLTDIAAISEPCWNKRNVTGCLFLVVWLTIHLGKWTTGIWKFGC